MTTLSDEIREDTKIMLVDAMMAGGELYLVSINRVVVLYSLRLGVQRVIFVWRREDGLTIRTGRPLSLQEAIAMVDANWDKRTHRPRDLEVHGLTLNAGSPFSLMIEQKPK